MSNLYFSGNTIRDCPLEWQKLKLSYTASGYGEKIPTSYKVFYGEKWRRVYCRVFSNIGSLYIMQGKEKLIINIEA